MLCCLINSTVEAFVLLWVLLSCSPLIEFYVFSYKQSFHICTLWLFFSALIKWQSLRLCLRCSKILHTVSELPYLPKYTTALHVWHLLFKIFTSQENTCMDCVYFVPRELPFFLLYSSPFWKSKLVLAVFWPSDLHCYSESTLSCKYLLLAMEFQCMVRCIVLTIYRIIHKSLWDFQPLWYSSWDSHAGGEHVNRGRDTPSFCPTLQVLVHTHTCNVCGRNLITGLTSAASPRVDIPSTCKVGQKLGVSLPLMTFSPSALPSRLLYRRSRKFQRDLWSALYFTCLVGQPSQRSH